MRGPGGIARAMSVFTRDFPCAAICTSAAANKSYPAARADPRTGSVASAESFLTFSGTLEKGQSQQGREAGGGEGKGLGGANTETASPSMPLNFFKGASEFDIDDSSQPFSSQTPQISNQNGMSKKSSPEARSLPLPNPSTSKGNRSPELHCSRESLMPVILVPLQASFTLIK